MIRRSHRLGLRSLTVLVALLCLVPFVTAFPFAKSSAVTELTPASFPAFVNTHKPVVVLFYAPWCGHCKHFHPEFEKFAQSVKGIIRVGAIDADAHSSVGQQYGVRGFPTIKYWKMGTKSLASPQDYQGQRTAAVLQSFMVSDIGAEQVRAVTSTEQLKQAVRDAPHKKVGVLFSAKHKVPPLLSVMALSPKLKELPLVFAGGCTLEKGMAHKFHVTQLPQLGILSYKPADGDVAESFEVTPYPKNVISYEPVAQYFLQCVEEECKTEPAAAAAATSAAATTATPTAATPDEDIPSTQQQQQQRSPSVALPVEPVEYTTKTIAQFCAPTTLKIRAQTPLCVISLTNRVNLANVYQQFQNDPLLFFDASKQAPEVVRELHERFGVNLPVENAAESGSVVLLRHAHPSKVRHAFLEPVDSDQELQDALHKVLNGELRFRVSSVDAK